VIRHLIGHLIGRFFELFVGQQLGGRRFRSLTGSLERTIFEFSGSGCLMCSRFPAFPVPSCAAAFPPFPSTLQKFDRIHFIISYFKDRSDSQLCWDRNSPARILSLEAVPQGSIAFDGRSSSMVQFLPKHAASEKTGQEQTD